MASMTGVATPGDSVALTGVAGVEGGLAKSMVGCPGASQGGAGRGPRTRGGRGRSGRAGGPWPTMTAVAVPESTTLCLRVARKRTCENRRPAGLRPGPELWDGLQGRLAVALPRLVSNPPPPPRTIFVFITEPISEKIGRSRGSNPPVTDSVEATEPPGSPSAARFREAPPRRRSIASCRSDGRAAGARREPRPGAAPEPLQG